jgi:competence protein ComEC
MGGRTAFAPALGAWAGLLAGFAWGGPPAWGLVLVAPLFWLVWRAYSRTAGAALALTCALLGAAHGERHARAMALARAAIAPAGALHRMEVVIDGPGARGGESVEAVVRAARPPLVLGTRLRLRLPEGHGAAWGDRLTCLARIEVAPGRRNPGGFDARAADFARGIAGRARVHAIMRNDSTGPGAWPRATAVRWRRGIERVLEGGLGESARAYVVPLVIGDRGDMTPVQRANIRDSGLAHLLALSGLHVTWLAWMTRAVIVALGGGLVARHAGGALSALFYAGIAGPLPALARAVFSEWVTAAARLSQRALDPVQTWSLSVLLLLAARPGWALDLAFQLSCAATLGLVTLGGGGAPARGLVRRILVDPLRVTAAAQLAAAPLLVATFHGLSWSVWLSNLAAVPVAGVLLGVAWLAALAELALPGVAAPLFAACEALAWALDRIAAAAAALPFAFVPCGFPVPGIVLLAAGAACLMGASLAASRPEAGGGNAGARRRALGGVLVATATLLSVLPAERRPAPGHMWVVALDIGQGDAIALAFPDGWWLVDAGTRAPGYDAGESIVVPFLRWAGVRRLATLALTHLDADHAGGARAVWRAFAPERILCPDSAAAALRPPGGHAPIAVAAGDTLRRAPLVRAVWPNAAGTQASRNDGSLVLVIEAGAAVALLTGDIGAGVEPGVAWPESVALLKVAHHGARGSTSAGFLARTDPREAVISAGAKNPFGHPHEETLARLADAGAGVHRTDREGAVWFELGEGRARRIDWRRMPALTAGGETGTGALARAAARRD